MTSVTDPEGTERRAGKTTVASGGQAYTGP